MSTLVKSAGNQVEKARRFERFLQVVLLCLGLGCAFIVFRPFGGGQTVSESVKKPRPTAQIEVNELARKHEVPGEVKYIQPRVVSGLLEGTIGWIVEPDSTLKRGDTLVIRDDEPIVYLIGDVPVWRVMQPGNRGDDVAQLKENLIELGYDTDLDVFSNDRYDRGLYEMVQRWQRDLGVEDNGAVIPGMVVFGPENARVVSVTASVREPSRQPVLLTIASSNRSLSFAVPAVELGDDLEDYDKVQVRLPDRTVVEARIEEGRSPIGEGLWQLNATIEVEDVPLPTGSPIPVSVSWETSEENGSLAVPASAIARLETGMYVVEVVSVDGEARFVEVVPGRRLGSKVAIETDLAEGTLIIAP